MRLSDFIKRDMEAILSEWESFAATLLPAAVDMNSDSLRDHVEQILRAVCKDLNTPQNDEERERKSKGLAAGLIDARNTAAETHALLRAQGGLNVNQMTSEYRALRASVLHLWANACQPSGIFVPDLIRFNEAIDQVAESVAFFNTQVEKERNLLLGMFGHDMRGPLQVIQLTARYLSKADAATDVHSAAARLLKSSASLKVLLDDWLDFNRTKLGLGITISPAPVDLAATFSGEIEQLRVGHPGRSIVLEANGDVSGVWDVNRLNQLLGNLVVNARTWKPLVHCRRSSAIPRTANVYITPGNASDFTSHDIHEVLVLQLAGKKCWSIYTRLFQPLTGADCSRPTSMAARPR